MTVGIIGYGKLGSALALVLAERGELVWVLRRDKKLLPANLSEKINFIYSFSDVLPDIFILVVPDGAISDVAFVLSQKFGNLLSGKFIIHCSGSLGKNILDTCKQLGAHTLALHPYQTFGVPAKENFVGIAWGIEADDEDKYFVQEFVQTLGGIPVFLTSEILSKRSLYHASASIASNVLTAVAAVAEEFVRVSGIEPNIFLPAIMRTTLENSLTAISHGNSPPLTGPIARGDVQTIALHLEALKNLPDLLAMYVPFAKVTADIAAHRGIISPDKYREILSLLNKI